MDAYRHYITTIFAAEDEVLRWIQAEADRHEMPRISLQADEGRLIQVLMHMIGAKKVLEIGTLAGYSGVWIARALPPDGKLITLEKSSLHAQVARASFEKAGVSERVTLLEGEAIALLKKAAKEAPFDVIFMDADRTSYVSYLEWVKGHLRPGGLLLVHNAFTNGNILAPQEEGDHGMIAFQQALALAPEFDSTIIGVGDGMVVAVKRVAISG